MGHRVWRIICIATAVAVLCVNFAFFKEPVRATDSVIPDCNIESLNNTTYKIGYEPDSEGFRKYFGRYHGVSRLLGIDDNIEGRGIPGWSVPDHSAWAEIPEWQGGNWELYDEILYTEILKASLVESYIEAYLLSNPACPTSLRLGDKYESRVKPDNQYFEYTDDGDGRRYVPTYIVRDLGYSAPRETDWTEKINNHDNYLVRFYGNRSEEEGGPIVIPLSIKVEFFGENEDSRYDLTEITRLRRYLSSLPYTSAGTSSLYDSDAFRLYMLEDEFVSIYNDRTFRDIMVKNPNTRFTRLEYTVYSNPGVGQSAYVRQPIIWENNVWVNDVNYGFLADYNFSAVPMIELFQVLVIPETLSPDDYYVHIQERFKKIFGNNFVGLTLNCEEDERNAWSKWSGEAISKIGLDLQRPYGDYYIETLYPVGQRNEVTFKDKTGSERTINFGLVAVPKKDYDVIQEAQESWKMSTRDDTTGIIASLDDANLVPDAELTVSDKSTDGNLALYLQDSESVIAAYDFSLYSRTLGKNITEFSDSIWIKIPIPDGIEGNLVARFIPSEGGEEEPDLPVTVVVYNSRKYAVFYAKHFSTYAIISQAIPTTPNTPSGGGGGSTSRPSGSSGNRPGEIGSAYEGVQDGDKLSTDATPAVPNSGVMTIVSDFSRGALLIVLPISVIIAVLLYMVRQKGCSQDHSEQ